MEKTLKCVIHEGLFHLGRQDPSEIAFHAFSQTTRNRKLAARYIWDYIYNLYRYIDMNIVWFSSPQNFSSSNVIEFV